MSPNLASVPYSAINALGPAGTTGGPHKNEYSESEVDADGDVLVTTPGVPPHVFVDANDGTPSNRVGSLISSR